MKRGESLAGGVRRNAPRCQECGAGNPRVLSVPFESDGAVHYRHEWLCAECEWKREHPEEPPRPKLPSERRPLPLQRETLF